MSSTRNGLLRPMRMLCTASLALGFLSSCDGEPPDARAPQPAIVEGRVQESSLTRITLTAQAEERLGVRVVEVARRPVARSRSYPAEAMIPPGRSALVDAPFAGIVLAPDGGDIPSVGSSLAAGTSILQLVPLRAGEGDLRVDAQHDAAAARARVAAAQGAATRTRQLHEDRAASSREVEQADKELAIARADLGAARTRLTRVSRTPLAAGGVLLLGAARSGVLQSLRVVEGQTVGAGSALFEVASLDPIWIRVRVYAGDLASVRRDEPARLHSLSAGSDAAVREARPLTASLSADAASATVDLYYELSNEDRSIRPGERLGAALSLMGEEEALVAPWSSILYDAQGGAWLYTNPEPHVYVRGRVDIREVLGSDAVLARGPAPGTRVVTDGAAELFGTEFGAAK